MDRMEKGRVVRSLAGRDRDRLLVVVGEAEDFPLLCDGKERPLSRPKRKNPRHLAPADAILTEAQMSTNRALRKTLRIFTETSMV
ncbi:MAG: KOW domain-containing RNA-binding protein [Candidatus Howiella sp.]|jgi:ribosomal protein L14E/L6E/L27E